MAFRPQFQISDSDFFIVVLYLMLMLMAQGPAKPLVNFQVIQRQKPSF